MPKILLIEDDVFLSDLYQTALIQAGHDVGVADTAQAAVDVLDEYGADAIVLDLALPGHNGIEVLQELQSHSDWASIPVLILSNQPQSSFNLKPRQWKDYGVISYLYKPDTTPAQLVKTVKNLQL